jgi:hypothetical protein
MDRPLGFEKLFNKDLLEAIGILFITAAGAETMAGLQLLRVLSHPRPLDLGLFPATAGMEMKVRLGIIRVRSAQIAPQCAARISKITSKIQDAFEHRNNIAHNMGLPEPTPSHVKLTILSFKGDGSLKERKTYNAKQIRLFSYLMEERLKALNSAITEAGVPPIPEQF